MAKTKTPYHSMGASGSVGKAITAQKLGSSTMMRKMPIPTDRKTLPQIYQRWDYLDYASRWHDLPEADKRTSAASGSRFHLTGFQYWMKNKLKNLPDIAVRWHLDSINGNTTTDFSKNGNTGTIIGASVTKGLISQCFSFDGVDDEVRAADDSSLDFGYNPFTIEMFLYMTDPYGDLVGKADSVIDVERWGISIKSPTTMRLYTRVGNAAANWIVDNLQNSWQHLAFIIDPAANIIYCYQQGIYKTEAAFTHQTFTNIVPLTLASYNRDQWGHLKCLADHFVIYNRALEAHEILRHSLRRYPV